MNIYDIAFTAITFIAFIVFGLVATGKWDIKAHPWNVNEESEKKLRLLFGCGSLFFLWRFINKFLGLING